MLKNSTLSDLEPFPKQNVYRYTQFWLFTVMTDISHSTTRSASSISQTSC